ncbi:MAG: hypothetical protein JXR96_21960 [Deltaproteobacteria bacterium]|nr:hypothetical protein [Deltaproteobacteria bacterium]
MAHRCGPRIACLVVWLLAGSARAGDFMDVRLTWALSDANLLAGDDRSPGLGILDASDDGARAFFDNYETKYTGFETLGHLVLYKQIFSFFDYFSADAALFVRLQTWSFQDEGSYIRIFYDWSHGRSDFKTISLTLFPLSADRFRLGYSYRISWAGTGIFPEAEFAPGARLRFDHPWGYIFAGFKTARVIEHQEDSEATALVMNHGALAGAGLDIEGFAAEIGGGYFSRGTFSHEGVRGRDFHAVGLSYQLGYHTGCAIGRSLDFELYRNDPYLEQHFFAPETYDGGLSWRIHHEGSVLWQPLEDPDNPGALTTQMAYAFDLNFALKLGFLRLYADALLCSVSYLLFEGPTYQDFPDSSQRSPEIWAAIGADYYFEGPRLTPGIKLGLCMPATVEYESEFGSRTVVYQDSVYGTILPEGEGALPIFTLKSSLRWDFAEELAFVAELYYSHDDNQVEYVSDFYGLNIYSRFADPHVLGFNLLAQARY